MMRLKEVAMQEVRQALDHLNQSWLKKRFDLLEQCFDEDVVMTGPGFKELCRGRSHMVQSYRDFMQKSEVTEYIESNHFVHEWGNTAVAGFDWSMTWIQNGKSDHGTGHDMFVFERRGDRWIAVLRAMLF
jgi:hypothetical protein